MGLLAARAVCQDAPPGWRLVWRDDFQTFDESKWRKVDTNLPTNHSRQDYLPEQVAVDRGRLVITSDEEPSRGLPYRSGQIVSQSEQRFGRWEVRANLPSSQGMWPAIWLLPDVDRFPWPSGGEIDILENRGNQPHLTSSAFHYGSSQPYRHDFVLGEQQTGLGATLANYHSSFHTYAVDWTNRYLRFYVDGVHHYTVHDEDVGGFLSQSTAPMQLVINTAIGGTFLPDPDNSTVWPQTLDVDWVKVYEPEPESFAAAFSNGGFEESAQAALAGWSVFGNDLTDNPNVRAASEAVASGDTSLKLFGTFDNGQNYSGVSQGITVEAGAKVTASLVSLVRSQDSIARTDNSALLKIEFYSEFGAKHGSPKMLGEEQITIAAADTPEDIWRRHELSAVTPQGAVEARVALVFCQPRVAPGAVHIDNVNFTVNDQGNAKVNFNSDG